jgi:sterol desaturase/sphingolipid hydroxylase (fatty acid hydroxylase superfamily)
MEAPSSMFRRLLSRTLFPGVMCTLMGSAAWLLERGASPEGVVVVGSLSVGLCILVLERLHPHHASWNVSRGDVGTDVLHLLVSNVSVPKVCEWVFYPTLFLGTAWLAARTGEQVWPTHWPLLLQGGLALLLAEFLQYAWHRACHEWDLLWRFHAIHHSAGRLYWLNAARFHPVDNFVGYLVGVGPLILLGCGPDVLAWHALFTAAHGLFQHANIRLKLGPLNWVFSMAELHRWHHSTLAKEGNTNYGSNLIVWDVVFGTRFLPRDREPPEAIGIGGMPAFPQGYLAQIVAPFRWKRTQEDSRG